MFGQRLKQLRMSQGMTQEELAYKLNKSRPSIAAYEIEDRLPNAETLIQIANYFKCSLDYLFGRTDIRSTLDDAIQGKRTELTHLIYEVEHIKEILNHIKTNKI